jgi:hypothetical protein
MRTLVRGEALSDRLEPRSRSGNAAGLAASNRGRFRPNAPEWTRTTTEKTPHKALNLIQNTSMCLPGFRSSAMRMFSKMFSREVIQERFRVPSSECN